MWKIFVFYSWTGARKKRQTSYKIIGLGYVNRTQEVGRILNWLQEIQRKNVLSLIVCRVMFCHKFDMFRHFKQTCFISTNLFIIVDVCCCIWSLDGVDNVHNFLYVKLQLLSDDYRETWWERSFVWDSSDLKTFKLKSSIEVFDCINWQKW